MINWVVFTRPFCMFPVLIVIGSIFATVFNVIRYLRTTDDCIKRLYHDYIIIGFFIIIIISIVSVAMYVNELGKYELEKMYEEAQQLERDNYPADAYFVYEEIHERNSNFMTEGAYSHIKEGMERCWPPMMYNLANQYYSNGEYLEAAFTWSQIKDYDDSERLMDLALITYLETYHPEWFPKWNTN